MPINPLEVLYWLLKPDSPKQVHANMGHLNSAGHVVFTEPHQKHIVGQSDLESMLHAQLDHLREPLLAHKPGVFHFLSGPWQNKTLKEHVLVPAVGMRKTKRDYYFDIELPGVHDKASIKIEWTSDFKLLVEGVIRRPGLLRHVRPLEGMGFGARRW